MSTVRSIHYVIFYPNKGKKGMYFDEPDSGGWYNFAYELSSDILRDSVEQARRDAPTTFGHYEIRKVEKRVNNLGRHSNPVLTRTPKNKWIARCVNCGLGSNGAKSTIQFALDNVKGQFEKYPNCTIEKYIDLGKV